MKSKNNTSFIQELQHDRQPLINQNHEIVDNILQLCIKHIKMLNSTGYTNIIYEVPSFLLGYPLYKISDISILVNKKLKKMGMKTLYTEPNKIYISWKKI